VIKVQREKPQLESLGEGRFRVGGLLDATTVTRLLEEGQTRFHGLSEITVDLGGVTESDSSGLALLLEWLRLARKGNQRICFDHVPQQIIALARISEVDDLLLENGANTQDAPSATPATA
jgi:phospholipid transport system transporter-binding protein